MCSRTTGGACMRFAIAHTWMHVEAEAVTAQRDLKHHVRYKDKAEVVGSTARATKHHVFSGATRSTMIRMHQCRSQAPH